jgi:CheY-like chemotaxis protein
MTGQFDRIEDGEMVESGSRFEAAASADSPEGYAEASASGFLAPEQQPRRRVAALDMAEGAMAHILVIDDEETILVVLRQALENAGDSVRVAGNGVAGLEQFQQRQGEIDLVIPVKDGFDALRELHGPGPTSLSSSCRAGFSQDRGPPRNRLTRSCRQRARSLRDSAKAFPVAGPRGHGCRHPGGEPGQALKRFSCA